MNKRRLLLLMIYPILSAITSCHAPEKSVILIPDPDTVGAPGIYAEAGGSLAFISELPAFRVTLTSKDGGAPTTISCTGGDGGLGDKNHRVECSIPQDTAAGTYTISVTEILGPGRGDRPQPPPITFVAYIRKCPAPCR